MRSGQPIPDRILNAPELRIGLQLYLQAYFELDTERPQSFSGLARIPWSAIKHYAFVCELDQQQEENLIYYVKQMDKAYIDYLERKTSKSK